MKNDFVLLGGGWGSKRSLSGVRICGDREKQAKLARDAIKLGSS